MSSTYAEDKIKEALRLNAGNLTLARAQIMIWAADDAKLLFSLAKPHLSGIVAYQVERVASGRADKERQESKALKVKPSNIQNKYKEEDFGMDLLRAVAASDAVVFGHEGGSNPMKKSGVSSQHVSAIKLIAAKSSNKSNGK